MRKLRLELLAFLAVLGAAVGPVGCAVTKLPNVSYEVEAGRAATPPVLGQFGDDAPVASALDWTLRRAPLLRKAFQMAI